MGTFNIGWLILLFLFLATLFVFWRVDIDKSPNYSRFSSSWIGVLLSMARLYVLIDEANSLPVSLVILILLPILGGALLCLIAFIPPLQNGAFEYASWALWGGCILFFLGGESIRVQWIAALILMTLFYSVQHLEGQPFSHKRDPSRTVKAGMRIASWLTGIKQAEEWWEEDSDSGTKHPSDSDNDFSGT